MSSRAHNEIPFTQYMMPDGRKEPVFIEQAQSVVDQAMELIERGYRFECEMLGDYRTISLTVVDPDDEGDVAIEVVPNGPAVPDAVGRLVKQAARHAETSHD